MKKKEWGHGNYLRVRGEYDQRDAYKAAHEELPPRARRIHGDTEPGH